MFYKGITDFSQISFCLSAPNLFDAILNHHQNKMYDKANE